MPLRKFTLAALILTVAVLFFAGDHSRYLSVRMYQDLFEQLPWTTAAVFFAVFLAGTACSLPVAGILTLAGGMVFGAPLGFILSLLAGTLGGTLAFFSTRFIFHDLLERRFSAQLALINQGVAMEGALYLFGLRMIPVIPFWLLNLLMGLTAMRASVFLLATLTGMVPVTVIFAYAGSQLGSIETLSVRAVLSPGLMLALVLMAGFPLLAKVLVGRIRSLVGKRQATG